MKKAAVCTVIGFPNGNTTTAVKIFETKDALSNRAGATFEDIELFSKHIGNGVKMNAAGGITSLKLGGEYYDTGRIDQTAKGRAALSSGWFVKQKVYREKTWQAGGCQ